MDVILHFGAHRCATSSFQEYMSANSADLAQEGIGYWGPERTRENGLNSLRDLTPQAHTRILHDLRLCEQGGVRQLIISQENFVGTMSGNFRLKSLYPKAKERAQRLAEVFDARVIKIALNIRAQDAYWSSADAYLTKRGHAPTTPDNWRQIVRSMRRWQDVICDIGGAFPNACLQIFPFEDFAGRPHDQLRLATGRNAPRSFSDTWRNAVRAARKHSFKPKQSVKLLSDYAEDLDWLASGAGGLARLMHLTNTNSGGQDPAETRIDERNPI